MLNASEKEILKVMQDKEYLVAINSNCKDIEEAINLGLAEFKELEKIVNKAFKNKEDFKSLCKRLGGHNEIFSFKYPNYNYFDLNYKSLLVTIKEKLDKNNNSLGYSVIKSNVYIYPDNISKVAVDEMCVLNFDETIDFEEIKRELEKEENMQSL